MANFDGPANFQRGATLGTWFAGGDGAQVGPFCDLDVAVDGDVAEMEAIFVGAGGHARRAAKRFIGINRKFRNVDSAKAAGMRAESIEDFFWSSGAELS